MSSHWLCAAPRVFAARLARCLPVLLAGLALTNGCGIVASSGATTSGEAGAVTDGASIDGVGTLSPDGSSCEPADVETYVPGTYHPAAAAWQGVCSAGQIAAFYDACLDPMTGGQAACSSFSSPDGGNGGCAACILTPDSADVYGPLINRGTFITNNVAGCIQLTQPSELSCARAEAALVGCELAACEANCPVQNSATQLAYDSCASAADGAGCQSYARMAACVQALAGDDAGAAAACLSQSFKAYYDAVVPLFCGAPPPPQDAGTVLVEAGEDAGLRADGGPDGGGNEAGVHDGGVRDAQGDAVSD